MTPVNEETATVLTMGAYGTPKCLCDECASLVETVTSGTDFGEISEAMETLTLKMSRANIDDRVTLSTVTDLLREGAERARAIKEGTYDFSLDESEEKENFDDIPEELQETEEDRLLDEKEAEENKKFDKILNYMWIGFGAALLIYIILRILGVFW